MTDYCLFHGSDKLRLMLLPKQPLQPAEFDQQAALEALCEGQTLILFLCDRVHQQFRDNIKSFSNVAENY